MPQPKRDGTAIDSGYCPVQRIREIFMLGNILAVTLTNRAVIFHPAARRTVHAYD
jgi:hypothetical protein